MSLFGKSKPKGITQEELIFIKGELRNGDHKLTETQTNQLLARLGGYMDSENMQHSEWQQMSESEVAQFDQQLEADQLLHLTPDQKAKVEALFKKYINIDKHRSIF